MLKKTGPQKGFTLAEVIITLSIVFVLTISLTYIGRHSLETSRNKERVIALEAYKAALEVYYHDHGRYPGCHGSCYAANPDSFPIPCPLNANGTTQYPNGGNPHGYEYRQDPNQCATSSNISSSLAYDNSESCGFLAFLIEAGYSQADPDWNDPLHRDCSSTPSGTAFNCRYIVPVSERNVCNVQRYLLHCYVEGTSELAVGDGGTHDQVYEIYGGTGEPWMCIASTP